MKEKNILNKVGCEVLITPRSDDYVLEIPDIGKKIKVSDRSKILATAREVIGTYALTHTNIPKRCIPESLLNEKTLLKNGQHKVLVPVDMDEFRNEYSRKFVRKNCSIPFTLAVLGEKHGINFSRLLTNALKDKLKISDEDASNSKFFYRIIEDQKEVPFTEKQANVIFNDPSVSAEQGLLGLINGLEINRYARINLVTDKTQTDTYLDIDGLKILCKDNLMTFGYSGHGPHYLKKVLKVINMSFNSFDFNEDPDFMLYSYASEHDENRSINSVESSKYTVNIEFYK